MTNSEEKVFKSKFKNWNAEHQELRGLLDDPEQFEMAVALLLHHHAVLHSTLMARTESWSFADALLDGLTDEQITTVPQNGEHSLAWLWWHMARIEDVAMNTLVAGSAQIINGDDWLGRMGVALHHSGNAMDQAAVKEFSETVDVAVLRSYRTAVGRRTREIVQNLLPQDLKLKVDPQRLQLVMAKGDLVEAASGIADYWGRRTVEGLLLMPATRHSMVHLNEGLRIRKKIV